MANEQEQTPQVEAPALTEIEQRASEQGWKPEDQWDGDPTAWRSAREFLDRGELFRKIDEQNRTIKDFKRALEDMAKHHSKVAQAEYKRAREELLEQKKEALRELDVDKVIQIDERIEAVKDAQRDAAAQPVTQVEPTLNPVFVAWVDKNTWYNSSESMRAYADRVGNQLGAQGNLSPAELLNEVERRVKKEFPQKFENPNRARAAAVEAGGNKAGGKKETYELTADERRMMKRFVEKKIMTEEQYIADLKKVNGVK